VWSTTGGLRLENRRPRAQMTLWTPCNIGEDVQPLGSPTGIGGEPARWRRGRSRRTELGGASARCPRALHRRCRDQPAAGDSDRKFSRIADKLSRRAVDPSSHASWHRNCKPELANAEHDPSSISSSCHLCARGLLCMHCRSATRNATRGSEERREERAKSARGTRRAEHDTTTTTTTN